MALIFFLYPNSEGVIGIVEVLCMGQTNLRTIVKLSPLKLFKIQENGDGGMIDDNTQGTHDRCDL